MRAVANTHSCEFHMLCLCEMNSAGERVFSKYAISALLDEATQETENK